MANLGESNHQETYSILMIGREKKVIYSSQLHFKLEANLGNNALLSWVHRLSIEFIGNHIDL